MLRRPSHFVTASNIVSRQDLDANRKADDEGNTTISVATLQDEVLKSRKQKSSLKGLDGKSELSISESKSSKSVHSKKIRKQPMIEQLKRDILDYLENLIEKTEWLALFYIKD